MCLFAALLALLVASPAHAQDVGPSGSFQTSYPIELPAYRGLEPGLGLTYDSSAGNGLLGVGWQLSGFSYIQRASPSKGAPNYDEGDVFLLDGMELIRCEEGMQSPSCQHPASSEYQAYTTKAESYQRIAFDPTVGAGGAWYVWGKDGTKTIYEPNFKYMVSSDDTVKWLVYNWSISAIHGTLDEKAGCCRNMVTYTYGSPSNPKSGVQELYPRAIEYIGAHTIIRFSYEERPDTITSATGGKEFSTVRYRLKTIDVTVRGQRARVYELRYANRDSSTGRSLLSEVQEYGRDTEIVYSQDEWWKATFAKRGQTLPPVEFDPADPGGARVGQWTSRSQPTGRWAPESSGEPYEKGTYQVPDIEAASKFQQKWQGDPNAFHDMSDGTHWLAGDLNGDGREDTMSVSTYFGVPFLIETAIATPNGGYEVGRNLSRWGKVDPKVEPQFGDFTSLGPYGGFWFPGDFDGDGKTDIIGASSYQGKVILLVAISNGDGTFHFARRDTGLDWQAVKTYRFDFRYSIGISTTTSTELSPTEKLSASAGLSFSGSIYQGPLQVYMPQRWFVGDVNGDGKADLMLANRTASETAELCTFVSSGDPLANELFVYDEEKPCFPTGWGWEKVDLQSQSDVLRNRFYGGDVDGNGKSDFIMVTRHKGPDDAEYTSINVALTDVGGQSFELQEPYKTDQPWQDEDVWFPGDPNGDGRTDLMLVFRHEDERHAELRTYESEEQGTTFDPTQVYGDTDDEEDLIFYMPPPCFGAYNPTIWFPADADGDGRTDFMQVFRKHDYDCHTNDTNDPNDDDLRLDVAVARTRSAEQYEIIKRDSTREYMPRWENFHAVNFVPTDVNDDGSHDLVFARAFPDNYYPPIFGWKATAPGPWEIETVLSPDTRRDAFNWQAAEVTGDGRTDLVYVEYLNPGIRVHTLPRNEDGSMRSDESGRAAPITQDIRPSDEDLPGLDNPNTSRWLPADVNADGRSDLVYVDYTEQLECSRKVHWTWRKPWPFFGDRGQPTKVPYSIDLCEKDQDNSGLRVYTLLSDGSVSDGDDLWEPKKPYFWQEFDSEDITQWRPMDVNGDGKVDLVHLNPQHGSDSLKPHVRLDTLLSNGDGTWDDAEPQNFELSFDASVVANWRPMDVNGDGKVDLVHVYNLPSDHPSSSPTCVHTLLSDFVYDKENNLFRGGWIRSTDPQKSGALCLNLGITDTLNWKPADVNADGKADLVHVRVVYPRRTYPFNRIDTLLSTGSGNHWQPVSGPVSDRVWQDTQNWKPADVNGDGRTDLVHVQTVYPRRTSPAVLIDTLVAAGDGQWKTTGRDSASMASYSMRLDNAGWYTTDADGNSMDDLLRVDYQQDSGTDPALRMTSVTSDAPLDLTTDFSNGIGGKTTVGYAPSSRWLAWNTPAPGCHLPAGLVLHHVSSVTTREVSSGTSDTVPYDYGCPRWSYAERSFLGYELTGSTHPETPNSPQRLSVARYKISDECGARIGVSEERAADHGVLSRTETYYSGDPGWDYHDPGSQPYRCLQESSVEYKCDAGTRVVSDGACAASYMEFSHDEFGNITETRECSYEEFDYNYNTAPHGCENTSPDDQGRTTLTDYRPAAGPYIVGLPSREAVFEGIGYGWKRGKQPARDTWYCYDGDDGCQEPPSVGLLTKTEQWNDEENRYHKTFYEYDEFGNQEKMIDANGNHTTTQFDEIYHLFPVKICNALDQCTEQKWDPAIQQVVQSIDANGYSTYFSYDDLGRPTQTCYPDGGVRQLSYPNWGDPVRQRVRELAVEDRVAWCEEAAENGVRWKEVDENSVRGIWTDTYLDGLGRTKAVHKEGYAPGVVFSQTTRYGDTSSRVYKQSHWYEAGQVDPIYEWFHYDELGRLKSQSHPDGSALSWWYGEDGTRTTVTSFDELGNRKTAYSDAFGRMVQVREEHITGTNEDDSTRADYDTFYEYDVLDNPTKVTDEQGNVTTMTWDSLGRQLTLDDPDMGRWTYDEYDDVGNLLMQTDARGVTTESTYDELNRLKTKQWSPPHGEESTRWNYDEEEGHGKAPVGRLTSVSDPTGEFCANGLTERLSYDEMGQVSSETNCVLGREYTTDTGYDLLGRQAWVRYPDGEKVNYDYDDAGHLQRMWSSTQPYVDLLRYDAAGHLTYAKLPNGTEERFYYDFDREWLTEASVQPADDTPPQQRCNDNPPQEPGDDLYQACYKYKPNGLVESTSSTTNKMNMSFTYDDLNRLTDVTGDMEQHLDYDSIGNMTRNSTLGDYEYRPSGSDGCGAGETNAGPHAVCRAGPREYEYDANGNMTLRDGLEILWNEENLPEWIEYKKGKWEHYLYDASGERVFKDDKDRPDRGKQKLEMWQAGSHEYQYNDQGTKRIVVSPGDSLWLISSKRLGPDATLQEIDTAVEQIYALNRDQIGPDPDLIFPGQEFLVPPTWVPERVQYQKDKHYLYDASGERVLKEPTGDPAKDKQKQEKGTYYFGPLLSYSSSGPSKGLTKNYYAGSMLIARKNSDGTHWFHSDHLGSIRLVTKEDGGIRQSYDYEPFGLGSSQLADKKFENDIGFGGHRADANTGLSYMGARYYDPQLARFISPDSIVPEEFNPQALNRYSYVYNNPLSYTDPTGHQPWWCVECPSSTSYEIPSVSPVNTSTLLSPLLPQQGFVSTQYQAAVSMAADPTNPWWVREVSGGLATLAAPLAMAEEVARGIANIPVAIANAPEAVESAGISIGEHSARALQFAQRGEAGEAFVEGLHVIEAASEGFVAGASVATLATGGGAQTQAQHGLKGANWAQKTYGESFTERGSAELSKLVGRPIATIDDLANAIKSGAVNPRDVQVNYVVREGTPLIHNTRTAQALERAGIPRSEWNAVNRTGDRTYEALVSGQLQRNPSLPSTGTPTIRSSNQPPPQPPPDLSNP